MYSVNHGILCKTHLGKKKSLTGIVKSLANRYLYMKCCQPDPLLNEMPINKAALRRRVRDEVGNEVEGVAAVSFHSLNSL